MENNVYFVKRTTLKKIADAIKHHQEKQNHFINVNIPVRELAEALRYGTVSTTAPSATEETYRIQRQTLVDVADVVRDITGTTEDIAVIELEGRILNLMQKLATPQIELVEVNADGTGDGETSLKRLETPKVYLYQVTNVTNPESAYNKEKEMSSVMQESYRIIMSGSNKLIEEISEIEDNRTILY